MRILGLGFTSSSSGSKANHLVEGWLDGAVFRVESVRALKGRQELVELLAGVGTSVLGIDFPFGLPKAFVQAEGWRPVWEGYVEAATRLPFNEFRGRIERFRAGRPDGQKEPKRPVDVLARSQSPLTTVRTPVANMFHAGAPLLLAAPCDVLPFRMDGSQTVVVESYPALVARQLVAGNRYKDGEAAQTREVRDAILRRIKRGDLSAVYGLNIAVSVALELSCLADEHGDVLDSLLSAIQAAWACRQRNTNWGVPAGVEQEGWITDPTLVSQDSTGAWHSREEPEHETVRGAFNSSRTRVRPVFRGLLRSDPTGRSWLPGLMKLAARNRAFASRLADSTTSLDARWLEKVPVKGPDGQQEEIEGCFERQFAPPSRLLDWCIGHPELLKRPKTPSPDKVTRAARSHRQRLLGDDPQSRADAQNLARQQFALSGSDRSRRAWWAFEGFTSVDCALETPELVLLIEGKRFESVSDAGSWIPGRNQISRNLEVAAAYAEQVQKEYAVLLVGPEGCQAPHDDVLGAGWPHLPSDRREDLMQHFLGATSWRSVCEAYGVDYNSLPVTVDDLREAPVDIA